MLVDVVLAVQCVVKKKSNIYEETEIWAYRILFGPFSVSSFFSLAKKKKRERGPPRKRSSHELNRSRRRLLLIILLIQFFIPSCKV